MKRIVGTICLLLALSITGRTQAPNCGPLDVALVIDNTGSMGPAIENIKAAFPPIISLIQAVSGGDYRLALVTFKDDINVQALFAPQNAAAIEPLIMGLVALAGNEIPEASDEAVNTVINHLPAAGRAQNIDFSTEFRPEALKIVILVTDAPPGGFDDMFTPGVDDVHAHLVASQAQAAGITISAIKVSHTVPSPNNLDTIGETVMKDYAATTSGQFELANPDGSGVGDAIGAIISSCGGPPPPPPPSQPPGCQLDLPGVVKGASGRSIAFTVCNRGPAELVSVRPFFNSACFAIWPTEATIREGQCAFFELNAIRCPLNAGHLASSSEIVVSSPACGSTPIQVEWVLRNR